MSDAPGWEAIDAALARLYGETPPRQWGTVRRWSLGGPDPLDGVSVYLRNDPVPHWHYISYGDTLDVGIPPAELPALIDAVRPHVGSVAVADRLVIEIVETVVREGYGNPTGEVVG